MKLGQLVKEDYNDKKEKFIEQSKEFKLKPVSERVLNSIKKQHEDLSITQKDINYYDNLADLFLCCHSLMYLRTNQEIQKFLKCFSNVEDLRKIMVVDYHKIHKSLDARRMVVEFVSRYEYDMLDFIKITIDMLGNNNESQTEAFDGASY